MPIYEYVHKLRDDSNCLEFIEVFQQMSEPPLTECPQCGKQILKKISLPGRHQGSVKDRLSDQNLSKHGFSKYVKSSDGSYEKAAGPDDAPSTIYK